VVWEGGGVRLLPIPIRVHNLMHQLYVYVDGSDLLNLEKLLVSEFQNFIARWAITNVKLINNRNERTPDLEPEDLPDWNLGLNISAEKIDKEKIEELFQFLVMLAQKTDREFAIGYWDEKRKISEDWCFVGKHPKPDSIRFLVEQLS
jgi:hypothetical protein